MACIVSGCDTEECKSNSSGQCSLESVEIDEYGECKMYEEDQAAG